MCRYQTLYQDDRTGYVVRCTQCEKIQVGYSNLLLTFGAADFSDFRHWLKKISNDQDPAQHEWVRCIVIPTPCEGMKLLLSRQELDDFHAMMESADTELQSLELMKLFENE